jgi:RNA polymerase sigma-70 factor (ECF subfamily)
MDFSLPAVKAALHRGRARLRELADEPDDWPRPELSQAERDRLGAYVAHFNARDFDAIRAMIADDVRLDLVSRTRMKGKAEVSRYFGNYTRVADWHLVPGLVQGRNISCCCSGRPTRSQPSATSATRLTSSMGPNI